MSSDALELVDTTLRDGAQSLWASEMRTGIIEAVGPDLDRAGFAAVEVPMNPIYFKKFIRDVKEDPWEMARVIVEVLPHSVKACMAGPIIDPFGPPPPQVAVELFYRRLIERGALNRVQLVANTYDQIARAFPWMIPFYKSLGVQVAVALAYTLSPRHTDAYYAEKARQVLAFAPDAVYLKDQGGLLTPERVRTLVPTLLDALGTVPFEVHTHNTTGLAAAVYVAALEAGASTVHTGIPPLADGSAQPSVFTILHNARALGRTARVDEARLRRIADRLSAIARQEGLPIGAPTPYDYHQYVHQVPGGVISNLRHQLAELGLQHRLAEVLEEAVRVRAELGYPPMITPHSQFVVTQAAINVAVGERWKVVIDDLILFAQGVFGEDSGYPWMDPALRERLLGLPRARELAQSHRPENAPPTVDDLRRQVGAEGLSDEEFLLRYIMKGDDEIRAMRAKGPWRRYAVAAQSPLVDLVRTVSQTAHLGYVRLEVGNESLVLARRGA